MMRIVSGTVSFVLGFALIAVLLFMGPEKPVHAAANYAEVVDKFGRTINDYRIDLLDWQGYLANPHVKLTVKPPSSAIFPVTITLSATGTSRLMMDRPSTMSATGATKTLTFANASEQKDFYIAIHPDRIGGPNEIENYTLSLLVRQNNGSQSTQTIPIRVLDQDDNLEPAMPLVFDYRFDSITGIFGNAAVKSATEQAIKDWFYFFDMSSFDTVAANAESISIPGDNWQNHITVTNNAAYNGMWVFLRGLNDPYSTGYPAANGNYHKRGGVQVPGPIHRSFGTILDFYPNFTPFTSLNDEDYYLTQMPGASCTSNCATDVLGLIMHEFGHAVAFHSSWSGMASYVSSGGIDPEVLAYQGNYVPLDSSYHISDANPLYWDRLSGQSGGRTHLFHPKRWMQTKLGLLIAENVGWKLNKNLTPFLAPSIQTSSLPNATKNQTYSQTLAVKGGVPFYDWTITSGSLPVGLSLNRFTGEISGTVSNTQPQGSYTFTVRLKDYDDLSTVVTKSFTITINGSTPPSDIVANYFFNETSGTTAADSSGNGKNATLSGGATWVAGHAGNALSLNGSNAYGSLPTGIVSALNDFTVATWVKVDASTNWTRIFDFGTGTSTSMFLTPKAGSSGGGLRFAITTSGSGGEQQLNAPALATGVWKHVAVTLSGTTGTLYVDGVQVASNISMTLKPSSLGNTNLNYLGRSQYSDPYLQGSLDDFRIYNRALSASEIAALAM
jgi:hypothetical protein